MVMVVLPLQLPLAPVTVYMVVLVGFALIVAVLTPPGNQAYVVAPVTVKVVLCPEQMVDEEALTASVGVVVTVTVTVFTVLIQPPVVPLTE